MVGSDGQAVNHGGELLCSVVTFLLREAVDYSGLELARLLITEIVLYQTLDLLQSPGLPLLSFHLPVTPVIAWLQISNKPTSYFRLVRLKLERNHLGLFIPSW